MISFDPFAAHTSRPDRPWPRYSARSLRRSTASRSGYLFNVPATSPTARAIACCSRSVGAYGFSLVFSFTGTSSCGAPYGLNPFRSSRTGSGFSSLTVVSRSGRNADPDRRHVGGQVLGAAEGFYARRDGIERVSVTFDHVHDLEVGVDRQPARVPRRAARGQHVVGPGEI